MLDSEIKGFITGALQDDHNHDLVSLTLESDCLHGVGLKAILTMSMWLAPRAGKPV